MSKAHDATRPPSIECEQHHACLAVDDVRASVEFYETKLGFQPAFVDGDPPTFAGVKLGDVQLFLERGTPGPKGCAVFFVVGDADALHRFHRSMGVEVIQPIDDRHYGLRDYTVSDPDGYRLRFGHYVPSTQPPLPIERIDVPVRLEKRLAALLGDLAEHKRMSLTSCLEEILLHTCEPFGDGVASPHTKRTLDYIQELKRKHGIEYDTHASYRFVEKD
jgi:catechol 2,3-dioxygenase-like lactoylglutathione lyase family enzyme